MISRLFCLGMALFPLLAHGEGGRFLGIRTTYTDDPKLDARINRILEEANQQVAISVDRTPVVPEGSSTKSGGKGVWWQKDATTRLSEGTPQKITLQELYLQAIEHSTQIKVFSDVPLIRETAIQEAEGVFDTRGFLESAYEYTNDPITTLLETGQADGRFTQTEFRNQAGIRKRVATGADVTAAQEFGFVDNNSEFLVPNPQGTSRLRLSIVQPLLRGAGLAYNQAIIDVAKIDTDAAYQEQIRQAESHLLEVCRAYWTLYFARVSYVRKTRYYEQAQSISQELSGREQVDAVLGQILRARSAVEFRRSELARAQMEIANAQDRIRTLVNSPVLGALGSTELIPSDEVISKKYPSGFQAAAHRAIQQRPEIRQSILQIRAAAVREKMSRNEILPQLNLILEGYVAGVEEDRNFAGAWGNQFNQGAPGALIGFSIEFPFENNAAKARLERRRIELRQQFNQMKTTIDTVMLEVLAAVREVETAWKDYSARLESVQAANADLEQFTARRELDTTATPDAATSSTSFRGQSWYLDEWLNTQSRLEFAEQEFARVATVYQVAVVNLERAQGNLLKAEDISVVRTEDPNEKNLPLLRLEKGAPVASDGLAK